MNEWLKLPGLFHRDEFDQVTEVDGEDEYFIDPVGHDDKGRELVAVYCRAHRPAPTRQGSCGSQAHPLDAKGQDHSGTPGPPTDDAGGRARARRC